MTVVKIATYNYKIQKSRTIQELDVSKLYLMTDILSNYKVHDRKQMMKREIRTQEGREIRKLEEYRRFNIYARTRESL